MNNMSKTNHGERQPIPVVRELTADTITDEQIRELERDPHREGDPAPSTIARTFGIDARDYIADALDPSVDSSTRRMVRARCAEILNARAAKERP